MDISVVVPLFNEEESLPELIRWIKRVMDRKNYTYEVILVDDGSNDSSWQVISRLHRENPAVRGIKFRRNYGKSAALFCGFEAAQGEVVITMDADLQDSPNEIPELVRMIREEKYDMVSGWKKKRFDPITKTIPSRLFNGTARLASGIQLHDFNCGLKAYRKAVVKSIEVYGEMHRYIPILAKHAGFSRIGEKVVQHQPRKYGTTKFGIERFVNGYLDLLSVTFISRFAKKPMHFFGLMGTFVFLFGFIATIVVGVNKLTMLARGIRAPLVADNPWFFIALTAMIIGTMLFLTGFIAELVSRSAPERNIYQIETRTDDDAPAQGKVEAPEPVITNITREKKIITREKQIIAAPMPGTSTVYEMPEPERISEIQGAEAPGSGFPPEVNSPEPEKISENPPVNITPAEPRTEPRTVIPEETAPAAENPPSEIVQKMKFVWERPAVTEKVPPEPEKEVAETSPAGSEKPIWGETTIEPDSGSPENEEDTLPPAENQNIPVDPLYSSTKVKFAYEEVTDQDGADTSQQKKEDEPSSAIQEPREKPRKVTTVRKKQKPQDNTLF